MIKSNNMTAKNIRRWFLSAGFNPIITPIAYYTYL